MELCIRPFIIWGSEYPLKLERSIIKAFPEKVKVFMVVNNAFIPVKWARISRYCLRNLLAVSVLGILISYPIAPDTIDRVLEIRESGHIFQKLNELSGDDIQLFILVKDYLLNQFHDLFLKLIELYKASF